MDGVRCLLFDRPQRAGEVVRSSCTKVPRFLSPPFVDCVVGEHMSRFAQPSHCVHHTELSILGCPTLPLPPFLPSFPPKFLVSSATMYHLPVLSTATQNDFLVHQFKLCFLKSPPLFPTHRSTSFNHFYLPPAVAANPEAAAAPPPPLPVIESKWLLTRTVL